VSREPRPRVADGSARSTARASTGNLGTMGPMSERLTFRFVFLREGGHASTFFGKHGWADDAQVMLGGEALGYDSLERAGLDAQGRVHLVLADGAFPSRALRDEMPTKGVLVLALRGGRGRRLAGLVNHHVSRRRTAVRRAELERAAGGSPFVSAACPACGAECDLTDADPSVLVQCAYCASLWKPGEPALRSAEGYGVCPSCGLWDRVQDHSDFNFYFLFVVYGWRYRRVRCCDGCAHGLFVRNLLTNLLFVLGVPMAAWVKWKSFRGRARGLEALPSANRRALKGDAEGAAALYARIDAALGGHPACAYNQAKARLQRGDREAAKALLGRALTQCPTFAPAREALAALEAPR
jgi:hypothetical protein